MPSSLNSYLSSTFSPSRLHIIELPVITSSHPFVQPHGPAHCLAQTSQMMLDHPCVQPRAPSRCRVRTNQMTPGRPWKRSRAARKLEIILHGTYDVSVEKSHTCLSGSMLAKPPEWLAWPPLDAISWTSSLGLMYVSLIWTCSVDAGIKKVLIPVGEVSGVCVTRHDDRWMREICNVKLCSGWKESLRQACG
jgi:hypothetical protein